MNRANKSSQLQIRVSPQQKAAITRYAHQANMGISEWVLNKALPSQQQVFERLLGQLKTAAQPRYVLAEVNDLLNAATGDEFELMTLNPLPAGLSPYLANYIAAMVEYAAAQKGRRTPSWIGDVVPLEHPVFGSDLSSLRLYLLTHSPPPFRRRNIFIDSTIGQRI